MKNGIGLVDYGQNKIWIPRLIEDFIQIKDHKKSIYFSKVM